MVTSKDPSRPFDLQDYFQRPENYSSRFQDYVPSLTVLMNCIFWTPRYPRLITKDYLANLFNQSEQPRLRVIGDITCDVNGSIECTTKCTNPDQPVYVWDTNTNQSIDGVGGNGPVILAVDHLPCELPRESSTFFSNSLKPFIPSIVDVDYTQPFEDMAMDAMIKKAVIAHKGCLTPQFAHLDEYLAG